MRFSIITPTNDLSYIKELYESICNQTYKDYEWVLYINGDITDNDIPSAIAHDEKVHIYYCDEKSPIKSNIGFLKNRAFNLGVGDILVEADHDDILTENALYELDIAYREHPNVGFVCSENAYLFQNDRYRSYELCDNFFDWRYGLSLSNDRLKYKDLELPIVQDLPPDASTLSLIYYAPNHIRTWRKDIYTEIGGHDVSLDILDDQDLMMRTYMATEFYQIKKPLYIYRMHDKNTCYGEKNDKIQAKTRELFILWQQRLVDRECDVRGLRKIDIGGGINKRDGYESIDLYNGDITFDLNGDWPLEDNSVGVINASHIIEHLRDKQHTMKEIYRVLCDGGWAFIEVPSTDGRGAFQDPTHVSYWNENSFLYYTHWEQMMYIHNTDIIFQDRLVETAYPNQWYKDMQIPVVYAWLRAIKSDKRICELKNFLNNN